MSRDAITSPRLPTPVGPFSYGVRASSSRELVYVSGQVGLDPSTGSLVPGGTAAQADQALRNIAEVLRSAGLTMNEVVKINAYLTDITDYKSVNEVYARFFVAPFPARTAVAVAALPLGARVELEAIAQ